MKIWTSGARFFGGQIDRIDDGFKYLGHELVTDISEADLVYCNNPWYDDAILAIIKGQLKKDAKVIFNVLDLAPHLGDAFPVQKLEYDLDLYADAVCTISETVHHDLRNKTHMDSTVIYQPIKNIYKMEQERKKFPFKIMFVGRVNDPNKRAMIGAEAALKLGYPAQEIITVGSDQPFYGGTWGRTVTDQTLNQLYNDVDFVMCCSHHEGIGLPAIEAMAAGAIPIICNDLSTRQDFFEGITEYDDVYPNSDSIVRFMMPFIVDAEKKQAFKDKLHAHYLKNLAYKMSGKGVAEAIIRVYARL